MRVLEGDEKDEVFNTSIQLNVVRVGKEDFRSQRDADTKERDEAKTKVEKLLKDKNKLEDMHKKAKEDLNKMKTYFKNIEKERDVVIYKCTYLAGDIDQFKVAIDELEKNELNWNILDETQTEYINYLAYLLYLVIEKLPRTLPPTSAICLACMVLRLRPSSMDQMSTSFLLLPRIFVRPRRRTM